jgi:hypothetical protein
MEGSGHDLIEGIICPEGLKKTTENVSQDMKSPGRDLNPRPAEYETAVLTTRPRRSVLFIQNVK